jgi:KaiC/GvpD/RAD55 family RecA-like ATPase
MLGRKDPFEIRYDITTIIRALEAALVTALLTSDCQPGCECHSAIGWESYLTDGVISLRTVREEKEARKRYIEIVKMRGSSHSLKPVEYEIKGSGMHLKTD